MINPVARSFSINIGLAVMLLFHADANAVSPNVIISEIFPLGTGISNTQYANDYVELYNQSDEPVSLANWSLQYAHPLTGGFLTANVMKFQEGNIIPAKGFYLIEFPLTATSSTEQPPENKSHYNFQLHDIAARLALVSNSTPLGTSYTSPAIVDLVGYGTQAVTYEGTGPAPALPTGQLDKSIQRTRNYVSPTDYTLWRDHDDNASDFIVEYKTRSNTNSTTRTHVPVSLSGFSLE